MSKCLANYNHAGALAGGHLAGLLRFLKYQNFEVQLEQLQITRNGMEPGIYNL